VQIWGLENRAPLAVLKPRTRGTAHGTLLKQLRLAAY
jgi:hypothetical protein